MVQCENVLLVELALQLVHVGRRIRLYLVKKKTFHFEIRDNDAEKREVKIQSLIKKC